MDMEFQRLNIQEHEVPPRHNQEPVEEEKGVGWRERKEDLEFWLGGHATPENSDDFEHLAHGLDVEAGRGWSSSG